MRSHASDMWAIYISPIEPCKMLFDCFCISYMQRYEKKLQGIISSAIIPEIL